MQTGNSEKKFEIGQDLVQKILEYFTTRPLGEVLVLWNEFHKISPIVPQVPIAAAPSPAPANEVIE